MCDKWNVRQATLQQMFKMTTFCMDTCFQPFLLLINYIVHHALLKFSPCRNKTLPQLVRIADWYWIRVKKIKKMKKLCILQGSAVIFLGVVDKRLTVCSFSSEIMQIIGSMYE